jgi:hypothetical protein
MDVLFMQQKPKQSKESQVPTPETPIEPFQETTQEPSPRDLQATALNAKPGEHNLINVRLSLSEIENYDEQLPEQIVRALLDPEVPDFFIPIQTPGRRIPRTKMHLIHTAFIRELILFDELPERKNNEG